MAGPRQDAFRRLRGDAELGGHQGMPAAPSVKDGPGEEGVALTARQPAEADVDRGRHLGADHMVVEPVAHAAIKRGVISGRRSPDPEAVDGDVVGDPPSPRAHRDLSWLAEPDDQSGQDLLDEVLLVGRHAENGAQRPLRGQLVFADQLRQGRVAPVRADDVMPAGSVGHLSVRSRRLLLDRLIDIAPPKFEPDPAEKNFSRSSEGLAPRLRSFAVNGPGPTWTRTSRRSPMKLPVRLVTTATGMLIAGASAAGGAGTLCARGGTSAHSSVSATSAAPAVMAGTESQGTASATLSASGTPPSMTRIVIPSQHLRDASATVSARPAHTGDDSAGSVDGQFGAASGGQAATSAIANPQASTATVAPGTRGSTSVASSLRNV